MSDSPKITLLFDTEIDAYSVAEPIEVVVQAVELCTQAAAATQGHRSARLRVLLFTSSVMSINSLSYVDAGGQRQSDTDTTTKISHIVSGTFKGARRFSCIILD